MKFLMIGERYGRMSSQLAEAGHQVHSLDIPQAAFALANNKLRLGEPGEVQVVVWDHMFNAVGLAVHLAGISQRPILLTSPANAPLYNCLGRMAAMRLDATANDVVAFAEKLLSTPFVHAGERPLCHDAAAALAAGKITFDDWAEVVSVVGYTATREEADGYRYLCKIPPKAAKAIDQAAEELSQAKTRKKTEEAPSIPKQRVRNLRWAWERRRVFDRVAA